METATVSFGRPFEHRGIHVKPTAICVFFVEDAILVVSKGAKEQNRSGR